ncbi:hypothetical protein D3C77_514270 [compost metagenome]
MVHFGSHAAQRREDVLEEIQRLQQALDDLRHDSLRGSRKGFDTLRRRAESLWHDQHLNERYDDLSKGTREVGRLARECVRKHPVSSAALAVGVCALIGCLVMYRR